VTDSRQIQAADRRQVIFGRKMMETQVVHRVNLQPGDIFTGPAIVEETSCTTVIPPGYQANVDAYGNMIITRGENA
jgi:N-methylhydantoinase A